MEEYVWSNGEKPKKSTKSDNPSFSQQSSTNDCHRQSAEHGQQAVLTALELGDPLQGFRVGPSKRDDVSLRMGERELVGRVSYNPFLTANTYVSDISVEDKLLRPQNTNVLT